MVYCASTVIVVSPIPVLATPIYCQCCGRQKLAEVRDGKLVIYDTRHGQRHFVVISLGELK